MTRETAINLLDNLIGMVEDNQQNDYDEAFKLAIRSLKSWDEDVSPVVHGEWIKIDNHGKNVRCSKCGNTLDLRGVNAGRGDANYCPNCGAKMKFITEMLDLFYAIKHLYKKIGGAE